MNRHVWEWQWRPNIDWNAYFNDPDYPTILVPLICISIIYTIVVGGVIFWIASLIYSHAPHNLNHVPWWWWIFGGLIAMWPEIYFAPVVVYHVGRGLWRAVTHLLVGPIRWLHAHPPVKRVPIAESQRGQLAQASLREQEQTVGVEDPYELF